MMKYILILAGILLLLTFLLPVLMQVFNLGNTAGAGIGTAYVILGVMWDTMKNNLRISALCVLVLICLWLLWQAFGVLKAGKSNAAGQKVLIVLGCRVKGTEPSLALLKRVDSAYFYLFGNPEAVAVLSGGQGSDEMISEAECMKRLLMGRGIAESRLFIEDKSTSTYENIRFSKKYLDELDVKEAAVATSEYHQKRALLICQRFGIKAYSVSSQTSPLLLPTFVLREVLALAREAFLK